MYMKSTRVGMERENIFFFKQKTAYDIGMGDWSSDVCSSDLYTGEVIVDGRLLQIDLVNLEYFAKGDVCAYQGADKICARGIYHTVIQSAV